MGESLEAFCQRVLGLGEDLAGETCEGTQRSRAFTAIFHPDGSLRAVEAVHQPPNCSRTWCCGEVGGDGGATGLLVWGEQVDLSGCDPAP